MPSNLTCFSGASRASMKSFSTSSISPASRMSELVCSVKMSIRSERLGEQDLGRDLLARLAQEVLLARRANDVVVGVPVARVVERVEPAQRLVARLDVDLLVVLLAVEGVVLVEVAAVDVDVDAVEGVDGAGEALEVDVDDVVDLQPVGSRRGPGQLLDRLQGQLGAAVRVGGVQLVGADARDLDAEVARQREEGEGVAVGVDAKQHRRVGEAAEALIGLVLRPLVGAEDHDRLRLAALDSRQLVLDAGQRLDLLTDVLDVVEKARGRGAADGRDDDHGRGEEPRPDREAGSPADRLETRGDRAADGLEARGDRGARGRDERLLRVVVVCVVLVCLVTVRVVVVGVIRALRIVGGLDAVPLLRLGADDLLELGVGADGLVEVMLLGHRRRPRCSSVSPAGSWSPVSSAESWSLVSSAESCSPVSPAEGSNGSRSSPSPVTVGRPGHAGTIRGNSLTKSSSAWR